MNLVRAVQSLLARYGRDLVIHPKAGGGPFTVQGVLRGPTPEELQAGAMQDARFFVTAPAELDRVGITLRQFDVIEDPQDSRRYTLEVHPAVMYEGATPAKVRAEVTG